MLIKRNMEENKKGGNRNKRTTEQTENNEKNGHGKSLSINYFKCK